MANVVIIEVYGQKAVDIGYAIQGNHCYRGLYNHGKRIAQLEVTIDDDGLYNGFEQKWVSVTIIGNNAENVVQLLGKIGFAGCWAMSRWDIENGYAMETVDGGWFKL